MRAWHPKKNLKYTLLALMTFCQRHSRLFKRPVFLKRSPHPNIGGVLVREGVSRVIPENQRNNLLQEIRAHMPPQYE
jgi:hypothetical protein